MTLPVPVGDRQIASWRHTRYPHKLIAAAIAEWALEQARGTELPGLDQFAGDLDFVASTATWKRAKTFLVTVGVLCLVDGKYQVA